MINLLIFGGVTAVLVIGLVGVLYVALGTVIICEIVYTFGETLALALVNRARRWVFIHWGH